MGLQATASPLSDVPARRARFLSGNDIAGGVRSDVIESWRRCRRYGVDPDDPQVPIHEIDLEAALCRAAYPVLDQLSERLSSTGTALVLASEVAEIAGRWGGDRTIGSALDRVLAVPGACLSERHVGTNGVGTAVELDRPVIISGAEHFVEPYQMFTCVGAPIHHPVTGRPLGVLDLVCRSADTNGLMMPLVLETVDQIERRLAEDASSSERAMLHHYLALRHSGRPEVVVLGKQLILASQRASLRLAGVDPGELREQALSAVSHGRPGRARLALTGEETFSCWVEPVADESGKVVAAVIDLGELDLGAADGGARPGLGRPGLGREARSGQLGEQHPRDGQRSGAARVGGAHKTSSCSSASMLQAPPGRSRAWQQVLHSALRHSKFAVPVLVEGEVGTGKLTLLRAMWQASGREDPIDVVDVALVPVEGPAALLQRLRNGLGRESGLVVLRHLELLTGAPARAVAAVLDDALAAIPSGVAVAATVTTASSDGQAELDRALADRLAVATITLPPLRDRAEDIPDIVDHVTATTGIARRWSPDALAVLARADWPGNVRQLANVVLSACYMRAAGDIVRGDLPLGLSTLPPRSLTQIEQVEKRAIEASLRSNRGNKVEAALHLGISRSTLYRKLRAYGIEVLDGVGARG